MEEIKITTQLDLEKPKKRTDHPSTKTDASQVLLPPTLDEKQAKNLMVDQVFCTLCEFYHKPNAKLRCALNRAMRKLEAKKFARE